LSQLSPKILSAVPGPRSRELAARLAAVESPAFDARRDARARASGADQTPIVFSSGEGSNVLDADGNRYVDLTCGFGALALGHAHPSIVRAANAQAERLSLALGDVYASESKVLLCQRLSKLLPESDARVMLGLSGADAVTAALKTAVLATGRPGVIAFEGAYHGLSYAPLAACGYSEAFRAPFAPQLGNHVRFVPYPSRQDDLERTYQAIQLALESGGIGAILVEPILGRGGCIVPPPSFLPTLRSICDRDRVLLLVDEVWTGLGRSGAKLACLEEEVVPDVLCLGKSLGAGWPVSACVGSARAMAAWGAHGGTAIHTATHFGAPPACAAALAFLDVLDDDKLDRRAAEVGERLCTMLRANVLGHGVRAVTGRGLMIGLELEGGVARALAVSRALLEAGWIVLTGGARGDVITLTPALNASEELLVEFASVVVDVLARDAKMS